MWVCFSVSPVSDGGGFVFNFDDNGGDAVENVCKAVCGAFGGRDVENINRNEKARFRAKKTLAATKKVCNFAAGLPTTRAE